VTDISGWTILGPLAYQGKPGCKDPRCTRDSRRTDTCIGWHCSYCDEPCSSQGHHCPAGDAILGEAERIARDDASDA
jgi:hypothetical protein